MASSKDSVNVEIWFVEGIIDDHVKLKTGMTACCIALPGKTDDSVYRGWGVHGSQTWILQFPAKRWIGGWWLTEAVLYMYGVVSLYGKNPSCAFWIRCHWGRLLPSSGGTLGYTWQGMVTQQLATGWWKCQTPSGLCSGCLPPWTRHHLHGLGPLSSGYELNQTYSSVSEPEATGSCSPKYMATDPSWKSPDLGLIVAGHAESVL